MLELSTPHLGPWGFSHFLGDVRFTPSQPPPLQLEWQGLLLPVGPEAKAGVHGEQHRGGGPKLARLTRSTLLWFYLLTIILEMGLTWAPESAQ